MSNKHHRQLCARRRRGQLDTAVRGSPVAYRRPAIHHRQQGRRLRGARHRGGDQVDARRIHVPRHALPQRCHPAASAQGLLRSAQGPRARHPVRRGYAARGRAPVHPGQDRAGVGGVRQSQSRQAQLGYPGRRLLRPSDLRDLQGRGRGGHPARSLSRHRRGAGGFPGRRRPEKDRGMSKNRWRGSGAVLVLAFALVLACVPGPARAAEQPKRGGTLVFGINSGDPPTYDCHQSTLFPIIHLLSPHYSNLLRIDIPNYPKLVGDLAESWTRRRRRQDLQLPPPRRRQVPRRLSRSRPRTSRPPTTACAIRPRALSRCARASSPTSTASTRPIRSA